MSNRPRPSVDLLQRETANLERAVLKREIAADAARDAEMELRAAIKASFANGLSASHISRATGLTVSRLYQISQDRRC